MMACTATQPFLTWAFQIPDNITFDQAASICIGIAPFVVPTYSPEPHGFGFTAPFEDEGGVGKYAGQPILIMAGGCSLGQYGMCWTRSTLHIH